jgi:hypothetical protein
VEKECELIFKKAESSKAIKKKRGRHTKLKTKIKDKAPLITLVRSIFREFTSAVSNWRDMFFNNMMLIFGKNNKKTVNAINAKIDEITNAKSIYYEGRDLDQPITNIELLSYKYSQGIKEIFFRDPINAALWIIFDRCYLPFYAM